VTTTLPVGGWRILCLSFRLTNIDGWTTPFQCFDAELLVLFFRVADPFRG
jgi:hypothetical protein